MHGLGSIIYPDGSMYEGEFVSDDPMEPPVSSAGNVARDGNHGKAIVVSLKNTGRHFVKARTNSGQLQADRGMKTAMVDDIANERAGCRNDPIATNLKVFNDFVGRRIR